MRAAHHRALANDLDGAAPRVGAQPNRNHAAPPAPGRPEPPPPQPSHKHSKAAIPPGKWERRAARSRLLHELQKSRRIRVFNKERGPIGSSVDQRERPRDGDFRPERYTPPAPAAGRTARGATVESSAGGVLPSGGLIAAGWNERVSASAPAHPWKRNLALASFSALLVGLLFYFDLIELGQVRTAFRDHALILALNVVCLLALSLLSVLRHLWVLGVVGVSIPWPRVAAANLVSQAIGQWAPGSMAVSELVRMGLMLGDTRTSPEAASRIAVAAIVDRLIGLGMTFAVGAFAGALLVVTSSRQAALLLPLSLVCLLLGAFLIVLPLLGGPARFDALALRIHANGDSRIARLSRSLASALSQVGKAAAHWRSRPRAVLVTIALSTAATLLVSASGYLTTVAVDDPISFLLLAAILPLNIISVILPIGFAGFGGPQLVAVALFAPFGVSPKTILALTLVQNTLVLGVQTTLGLLFGSAYGKNLAAIARARLGRRSNPS